MWNVLRSALASQRATNAVRIKHEIAARDYGQAQRQHQEQVKNRIRKRLATHDYSCHLPKPPKPRVRVKLRLVIVEHGGYVGAVYKASYPQQYFRYWRGRYVRIQA